MNQNQRYECLMGIPRVEYAAKPNLRGLVDGNLIKKRTIECPVITARWHKKRGGKTTPVDILMNFGF